MKRLTLHTNSDGRKLNLGSDKYLRGNDGKSAYEIWLEEGNAGTEEDFLTSLKGKDGHTPIKGTDYFTEADKAEIVEETVENIPTASATTKGAVKVGEGLTMSGDVLNVHEYEWVLLESGKLEAGTLTFERSAEPNGTPYNLKALKIKIACTPGQVNGLFDMRVKGENNNEILRALTTCHANTATNNLYRSTAIFQFLPFAGQYLCVASSGTQGGIQTMVSSPNTEKTTVSTNVHMAKFNLFIYNNIEFAENTEFEIWGVRA